LFLGYFESNTPIVVRGRCDYFPTTFGAATLQIAEAPFSCEVSVIIFKHTSHWFIREHPRKSAVRFGRRRLLAFRMHCGD
jgi:hypothetical protein